MPPPTRRGGRDQGKRTGKRADVRRKFASARWGQRGGPHAARPLLTAWRGPGPRP